MREIDNFFHGSFGNYLAVGVEAKAFMQFVRQRSPCVSRNVSFAFDRQELDVSCEMTASQEKLLPRRFSRYL